MKFRAFILLTAVLISLSACTQTDEGEQTPSGENTTEQEGQEGQEDNSVDIYMSRPSNTQDIFVIDNEFSCEFDTTPDPDNWSFPNDTNFAAWSFSEDNNSIKDEVLNLTLTYEGEYTLSNWSDRNFYFKSGMMRSVKTTNYGYYEAKIKGAPVWPGTCTAFWLYSKIAIADVVPQEENTVSYNEIDVIEIQQYAADKQYLASNLHLYALSSNGSGGFTNTQYKASKNIELMQTKYHITDFWSGDDAWYAEDDFHIYACENRPDSIVFYVDNVRTGAKRNYYWHLDMYVTLSLGLRTPYEYYDSSGTRYPSETTREEALTAGFPASMEVEYIRTYRRSGGYDATLFPSSQIPFVPDGYEESEPIDGEFTTADLTNQGDVFKN